MASSGVKPDSTVIDKYNRLKLRNEFGYLLLKIHEGKIVIFEEGKKGAKPDEFMDAVKKQKDCCFAIYDGQRVGLFAWNPDTAPAKSKMLLASSSEALTTALEGVGQSINVSDSDELKEKMKEKNIV